MTHSDPYRDDARDSLDAARQQAKDILYSLERCRTFRELEETRDAVERASSLLAAASILVRTAGERRRKIA